MKTQIWNLRPAISLIAVARQTKFHTAKQPLGIGKASTEGGPIDLGRKMPARSDQQSEYSWFSPIPQIVIML